MLPPISYSCLSSETEPLREYLAEVLPFIERPLGEQALATFHYLESEIRTNWKLRTDNTRDYYHTLMHSFNRKTSRRDGRSPYRWSILRNGHAVFSAWDALDEAGEAAYEDAGFNRRDADMFPGLRPNEWILAAIFPNLAINIRTTACRLDRVIPNEPGRVVLETRGIGLKSDSLETRARRVDDYTLIWGPIGRNQPEDIVAWEGQWETFKRGAVSYSVIAREEDLGPFDDESIRWFYRTWEHHMHRPANRIDGTLGTDAPEGWSG